LALSFATASVKVLNNSSWLMARMYDYIENKIHGILLKGSSINHYFIGYYIKLHIGIQHRAFLANEICLSGGDLDLRKI
jgi:hypothetical protein